MLPFSHNKEKMVTPSLHMIQCLSDSFNGFDCLDHLLYDAKYIYLFVQLSLYLSFHKSFL